MLGLRAAKPPAMPRDDEPYTGPLVIIRQVSDHGYEVGIDPPLPGADCEPRQFGSKCEAYAAAQGLWTKHRLGCRDELVGNIGRLHSENTSSE